MGGAQSLGQVDVGASGRKWAAETNAEKSMIGAFGQIGIAAGKIFDAQDDAEDSLLYQQTLHADTIANTDITTFLNNTPQVDVNLESTPLGVVEWLEKNKTKYTIENGRIATDKFSLDYLKDHYAEQGKNALSTLKDTEYRDDYVGNMTNQINVAAGQATLNQIKQRQSRLRADADNTYNDALNNADEGLALQLIEDNVKNKVWTPEDEVAKKAELGGIIDHGIALEVLATGTPAEVQRLEYDIWNTPNRMSNAQVASLDDQIKAREKADTARVTARNDKVKTEISQANRADLTSRIAQSGTIPWSDIDNANLSPMDEIAVVSLNKSSVESNALKSDPQTEIAMQLQVMELSIPSEVPIHQARYAALVAVSSNLSDGLLTPEDADKFFDAIKGAESLPYNTAEYKRATDRIYLTLVGVSKDANSFTDKSAVNRLNALNMEEAMIADMRAQGTEFNADKWVSEKMPTYALRGLKKNADKLEREQYKAFAIKENIKSEDGSTSKITNITATEDKIRQQYKDGKINKAQADNYEESLRAEQRLIEAWGGKRGD